MKYLLNQFQPKLNNFIFRGNEEPGSADTMPLGPVVPQGDPRPAIEKAAEAGLTLDPRGFRQPDARAIGALTGELENTLDGGLDKILSNPRLQGAAQFSGINAETLGDTVRSLGLGGQDGVVDTLAATARNFASQVERGEVDGSAQSLFAILQKILAEAGVTIDPQDENAQRGVRNLGAGAGAYNLEPSRGPGENPPGTIGWQEAAAALNGVLTLSSSGAGGAEDGSSRASNRTCLDGLRSSTVSGAKALQQAVGGALLTCTGGTEEGHASGAMSHFNGYKLDYAVSNDLIQLTGLRGMGQKRSMTIGGQRMDFYRHAPDHFDVKFHPA